MRKQIFDQELVFWGLFILLVAGAGFEPTTFRL